MLFMVSPVMLLVSIKQAFENIGVDWSIAEKKFVFRHAVGHAVPITYS